jgi:hypothetical protein
MQSSVALPQILQNHQRKSVAGFRCVPSIAQYPSRPAPLLNATSIAARSPHLHRSAFLLYCWLSGDMLKTAYFTCDAVPLFLHNHFVTL